MTLSFLVAECVTAFSCFVWPSSVPTRSDGSGSSEGRDRVLDSIFFREALARFAAGARGRGRGAAGQEDRHRIHESLFQRVGSIFPPSPDPVARDEGEHSFHHL